MADVATMSMRTVMAKRLTVAPPARRPRRAALRVWRLRVAALGCVALGGLLAAATPAFAATPYTAYVSSLSEEALSPINTATNVASSPITGVKNPPFLAITPNGATAWVTNTAQGTVTPITLATGALGTPVPVGSNPDGIAITPDGTKAYVADHGSESVTPINLTTDTAGPAIKVGKEPWAIAISPDASKVYVTNYGSGSVTPIAVATNTPGTPITVGAGPQSIAVAPDGMTAWVADFSANAITPINLATNAPGSPVTVKEPNSVAITPDGQSAYVTDYAQNSVTPVNLLARTAGTPIKVGSTPYQVAISPDGRTAYVTNNSSNSVTPVNTATQTAGAEIKVASGPDGIAITPDEAPVASFTVTAGTAGSPSSFDASASSVAYGTITTYAWNFGDGASATTSTPTTTHTYAAAGDYTATLTETDSAGTSTTQVFTGQTVSRNGGPSAQRSRTVAVASATLAPSLTGDPRPTPVLISIRSVTVNRHGNAVIPVTCPASASAGCRGTITITVQIAQPHAKRASAARCARGCRPLGTTNYQARAGQKVNVRVHIASFGRRLLSVKKSVRVTLTASSVAAGQSVIVTRAISLKR
jgi:YVTN family beta-propeller protein